jgi:hypothetical protein
MSELPSNHEAAVCKLIESIFLPGRVWTAEAAESSDKLPSSRLVTWSNDAADVG